MAGASKMYIRFWGVRGSIATPGKKQSSMVVIHHVLKSDVVKKYSSWMLVVVSGN